MRIVAAESHGIPVLALDGALTLGRPVDTFGEAWPRVFEEGGKGLVLDCTRLAYLDSAGIGAIVACAKAGAEAGRVVKVVLPPDGPARRIFELTQLERAFEIFGAVDDAAASFP